VVSSRPRSCADAIALTCFFDCFNWRKREKKGKRKKREEGKRKRGRKEEEEEEEEEEEGNINARCKPTLERAIEVS